MSDKPRLTVRGAGAAGLAIAAARALQGAGDMPPVNVGPIKDLIRSGALG